MQEVEALKYAILHLLLVVVARVFSLVADGSSPEALQNFAPAVVLLVLGVTALILFKTSARSNG
jgi:hypothetical protein